MNQFVCIKMLWLISKKLFLFCVYLVPDWLLGGLIHSDLFEMHHSTWTYLVKQSFDIWHLNLLTSNILVHFSAGPGFFIYLAMSHIYPVTTNIYSVTYWNLAGEWLTTWHKKGTNFFLALLKIDAENINYTEFQLFHEHAKNQQGSL